MSRRLALIAGEEVAFLAHFRTPFGGLIRSADGRLASCTALNICILTNIATFNVPVDCRRIDIPQAASEELHLARLNPHNFRHMMIGVSLPTATLRLFVSYGGLGRLEIEIRALRLE